MTGLFRKEVVSKQASRLEGEISLAVAPGFVAATALLGVFLIVALVLLSVSSYSKKETVSGLVSPATGLIVVRAPVAGSVKDLIVHQGAPVEKGQGLLVLGQQRFLTDGDDTETTLIDALKQRLRRAERSLADEQSRFDVELLTLGERRSILGQRIHTSEQRMTILQERADNQAALIDRFERLVGDQYVSEASLIQQRDNLLSLKEQLVSQQLALQQLGAERLEFEQQLREAPIVSASNRETLQRRHDELVDKLMDVQLRSATEIRSPVRGTLSAVMVLESEYVEAGQPLMHVYSGESELEALLYVPSTSIGMIAEGQKVNVRFAAFPHEKFGVATGRVVEVSRSVVREEDRPAIEGLSGPTYVVKVQLPSRVAALDGQQYPIRPGMLVKAEIEVDRRSIIQWIAAPFKRIGQAG